MNEIYNHIISVLHTLFGSRRRRYIGATLLMLSVLCVLSAFLFYEWQTSKKQRRQAYDQLIRNTAARHAVSPHLIKAVVWRESNFRPLAVGKSGEIGLMQITVGAAEDWAGRHHRSLPPRGLLFNPRLNIEIGTWYLARAFHRWSDYRHTSILALAEYNAGPKQVHQWVPEDKRKNPLEEISFPSTRKYIKAIQKRRDYYKNTATFN